MKVVDVDDAGDGGHGGADFAEAQVARRSLEKDVECFADDAEGAEEDHAGDEDGENGIDPG